MKVSVDSARCQGHTLCAIPAPDIFLLDEEEGHAYLADEDAEVPSSRKDDVLLAARSCPETAIFTTE